MIILFYDINSAILFPIEMLSDILNASYYFYNDDYLLLGINKRLVVTSNSDCFLQWKINKSD